jgi:hypothetical protein
MEGKSVTIGVRVPEELRDVLADLAKADNRTLSQYAMLVLREHAEKAMKAKKPRK